MSQHHENDQRPITNHAKQSSVWICTVFALILPLVARAEPSFSFDLDSARRPIETPFSVLQPEIEAAMHARTRLRDSELALPDLTSYSSRVPLKDARTQLIASWSSNSDPAKSLASAFLRVRDERFLYDRNHLDFVRRLSWMYPDDGCATRADLMAHLLRTGGFPEPSKVFAFGDLVAKTPFAKKGRVGWWYHVAVAYRSGNEAIVFDPSIEPLRPLTLKEWTDRMGGEKARIQLSICSANAFDSESTCNSTQRQPESALRRLISWYLSYEWNRAEDLQLVPEKVLGDEPPWKRALELPW